MQQGHVPILTPRVSVNGVHCAPRHRNADGSYTVPFEVDGEACEGRFVASTLTVTRLRDGVRVGYEGTNRVQKYKNIGSVSEVTITRLIEPPLIESHAGDTVEVTEAQTTEFVPQEFPRPNFDVLQGGVVTNRAARRRPRP